MTTRDRTVWGDRWLGGLGLGSVLGILGIQVLSLGWLLIKGDPASFLPLGALAPALSFALALTLGLPMGLLGGLYLSEWGETGIGKFLKQLADLLSGVSLVTVGLLAWRLVHGLQASGPALGLALFLLLAPRLLANTEAVLSTRTPALREAGLALGIPRWRVALDVVLRSEVPGLGAGAFRALAFGVGGAFPLILLAFHPSPVGIGALVLLAPGCLALARVLQGASSPQER